MRASSKPNPFTYPTPVTSLYERVKLVILGVTLFPIRVVCFLVLLIGCWACCALSNIGASDLTKPTTAWWRKALRWPISYLSRGLLFCCGIYWIRTKGRIPRVTEAPIFVVAPHSGFMDIIYMMSINLPCAISMQENLAVPFIGSIIQGLQMITVDRASTNSRHETMEKILARAKDPRWPQTLIYPEGICTNRQALCLFKQGAFAPGVPVQPVCLRYPHRHYNYCWVNDGPGLGGQIFRQMCQFVNYMEVEYLPVYTPSKEEIADATLYAENVRVTMAKALGLPLVNQGFDDVQLTNTALRHGAFPPSAAAIEFVNLKSKKVPLSAINHLLEFFMRRSVTRPGTLTQSEVQRLLDLPDAVATTFFNNLTGEIGAPDVSFRDLTYALAAIYHEVTKDFSKDLLDKITIEENASKMKKGDREPLVFPQFAAIARNRIIATGGSVVTWASVDEDKVRN